MKKISFSIPTKSSEVEAIAKRSLLSYKNFAQALGWVTLAGLAWGNIVEDATRSDQLLTILWGGLLFGWASFLVFVAKSAERERRSWWAWMLIAFFLPIVGLIGAFFFVLQNLEIRFACNYQSGENPY